MAVFDAATQDSGNVSYGVKSRGGRLFIKTAGDPDDRVPFLRFDERVLLLRNAVRIARAVSHPALPVLRNVVESAAGPLLVYDWVDGELLGATEARRREPGSAYARFRGLPVSRRVRAIDDVLDLHVALTAAGWIASDFYDGSLIYDFVAHTIHVVDLDSYRIGPFINHMGRMFGSTRFMAPEELALGAPIDERTTVFTMGRTIQQFILESDPEFGGGVLGIAARACELEPRLRFPTMAAFYEAWSAQTRGAIA